MAKLLDEVRQLLAPIMKEKNLSAQMLELEVYSGPIFVGTGYVFYHKYGLTEPTLIGLTGKELPEGWFLLKIVGEPKLVVINRTVQ